jgi:hypothetical protein
MLRKLLPATMAAACLLLPAAPASARIIDIGKTATENEPSCPGNPCLAVSRTTGYQARVGDTRKLFVAPANGRIVAWTVTLGEPGRKQRAFFEKNYGGAASAGITVWRPGEKRKLLGRATGASPLEKLRPFFGETVQFPLDRSIPVRRGNQVALSVPTWAPVLAVGLGSDASWRASRPTEPENKCQDTQTQTVHRVGTVTEYRCLYRTARLTYSVTMITEPKPPTAKQTT